MSKLSFEELKKKAKEVEIKELMESISGGTENSCHVTLTGYLDIDAKRIGEHIEKQRKYQRH
ncbi:hypothetical protein CAPN004_21830 [Capnocytophaga cynodegmi]|uniref:hypothetical protein n=1 Tax=Capnocytophaga cynodegmi TaxID=28189 RepID=UPI001AC6FE91|nr:hypothetical protein [Capnocytophaga cynodegmi]GIM53153.1 hypothetical protein CAPN004_21830 [Capnocytophaga cynodegmi]